MEGAGLKVDVKTLYSLCEAVAEHCENSVVPKIRQDIFNDFCAVHLDESPWPIMGRIKPATCGQQAIASEAIIASSQPVLEK